MCQGSLPYENVSKLWTFFAQGGWGHSLALGGVFPNIKAAIPG